MAEKKKSQNENDVQEVKVTTPIPESGNKRSNAMMVPLVIVAILIGIAGLGIGGYFLFTNMHSAKATEEEEEEKGVQDENEIKSTNIFFSKFPENVVNLKYSENAPFTYLKYAFAVELDSKKTEKIMEEMLPRLSSCAAAVMINRDWNEISTSKGRSDLAKEVMAAINEQLEEGEVINLFFTTFVAQ